MAITQRTLLACFFIGVTMPEQVAILAYSGQSLFELGCATELFVLPRPEFASWYQGKVVSFEQQITASNVGVQLLTEQVSSLEPFDMLVVPSWYREPIVLPAGLKREVCALVERGGRVLSFCSGAFLLAELGLLVNRPAITHWLYAEQFKARFPALDYQDNVLYHFDGQIGCSAGSAAAMDLGIAVIREDFGYKVANQVARRLVLAAHRGGGQCQFTEKPVAPAGNHFAKTLDWACQHLAEPLSMDMLASRASMSRRTFERRFRQQFNLSPQQWLVQQRLHLAKQLLEQSQHPIERIAQLSGFDNAVSLRHHFRRQLACSPSRYREQFLRCDSGTNG